MMRQLYTLVFLLTSIFQLAGQQFTPLQGYIVTKNNYHLTGAIGQIDHSAFGTMVEYINDFGTPYFLHPALIKGFVFFEGPAVHAYESKFWHDHWLFLRVQYAGQNIKLLQTPEYQTDFEVINGQIVSKRKRVRQFWVEVSDGRILPLKRLGFRRQMKSLIEDVSPQLAKKIGTKGYRFEDLYTILAAYDEEFSKGKRRL